MVASSTNLIQSEYDGGNICVSIEGIISFSSIVLGTKDAYIWKVKFSFFYLWNLKPLVEVRNGCLH